MYRFFFTFAKNLKITLMKNLFLTIAALCLFSFFAAAQDNLATTSIKTTFHCANGKALLETELAKVEGIKEAVADLETKIVTVKYDEKIINKDGIVAAIEKIGYFTEFTPQEKPINKACSHGDAGHQE